MKWPIVIRIPVSLVQQPRDWRALIALGASIAGAAVLTAFAWSLVNLLDGHAGKLIAALLKNTPVRDEVAGVLVIIIRTLAWGLKLTLVGVIAVLLSLGLAINRRNLELGRGGLKMSGGDGDDGMPSLGTVAAAAAGAAAGAVEGAKPVAPDPEINLEGDKT